jgi:hypothetical protein
MKRALAIAGILLLAISGTATAGQPDTVDPLLMQPPLNPTFGPWTCYRTGDEIVCDGERTITWEAADYGIVCDGRPVLGSGYEHRTQRRWGDANGLALKTLQHFKGEDTVSLNADMSGPTLRGAGQFTEVFEYAVPGDLSTRTDTYRGLDVKYVGQGVGLVIHDVGTKSFDIDDNVLFLHGQHPVVTEGYEAAFSRFCPALLG